MKARKASHGPIIIEASHEEVCMLITTLQTYSTGNLEAAAKSGGRVADQLLRDSEKSQRLSEILEGVV